MAKNDFKAFATDRNANVMSQEEWEALPALLSGFTAGKASSAQVNKVIRQASFIAAALAQFVSDKTQRDVLDNGDLPGFVELLGSGFAVEYLSRKNPFGDIKSDGTVKTALENLSLVDGSGVVGRLLNTKVITSSGTYTPTPGTKRVRVTITGGGGGGAGCSGSATSQSISGSGGGAGATAVKTFDISAASYPVTIGSGGNGGVGALGGSNGGSSSINGITAGGGVGGFRSTVTSWPGGNGGGATGGDINISGGAGADGQSATANFFGYGNGGASFWGGGGRAGNGGGASAVAYGAGGGGAYDSSLSGTAFNGGKGAAGICVIEEYA
ncbi:hypothetical protein DFZ21_07995 [Escherichia coli]|nr:hypothetical protein [Escherichia coli]